MHFLCSGAFIVWLLVTGEARGSCATVELHVCFLAILQPELACAKYENYAALTVSVELYRTCMRKKRFFFGVGEINNTFYIFSRIHM